MAKLGLSNELRDKLILAFLIVLSNGFHHRSFNTFYDPLKKYEYFYSI
jgi:hypothetical protein